MRPENVRVSSCEEPCLYTPPPSRTSDSFSLFLPRNNEATGYAISFLVYRQRWSCRWSSGRRKKCANNPSVGRNVLLFFFIYLFLSFLFHSIPNRAVHSLVHYSIQMQWYFSFGVAWSLSMTIRKVRLGPSLFSAFSFSQIKKIIINSGSSWASDEFWTMTHHVRHHQLFTIANEFQLRGIRFFSSSFHAAGPLIGTKKNGYL